MAVAHGTACFDNPLRVTPVGQEESADASHCGKEEKKAVADVARKRPANCGCVPRIHSILKQAGLKKER